MTPAGRPGRLPSKLAIAAALALAGALAHAQEPPLPPAAETAAEAPALRVLRTGGLRVETAALIMSGQEGGRVQLGVLPQVLPGTGERARVPVLVEIDGSALLATRPAAGPLRFEVAIYAIGASGASGAAGVGGSLIQTVEVDLGRLGAAVERSGVKLGGELALLPGDYSLRVLVRALHSPDMGLRIVPLTVPAAGGPLLSPPLFAEPVAAWVEARSAGAGQPAAPATLAGGGLPAARPIVQLGEEAAFDLVAAGLGDSSGLRLELATRSGEKVADLPARAAGAGPGGSGRETLRVSFEPRGVAPGEYQLRAVLPGPAGEARSAAPVSLIVADGSTGGRVWAEFTGPRPATVDTGGAPAAAEEAPRARRRRGDKKPVVAAWRAALAKLAQGDEPGARAAVAEIEGPLFTGPDALLPEDMAEIELDPARQLAAARPESLVPVLMLYERLYLDYRERRWFLATAHAWEMVFRLADLYVDASRGAEPARQLAARFLVGLAKELVEVGPAGFRERAFSRALELNPENEAARLGLAVDAERHGEYREATGHLERLLASRPDHAEARLRLAVNLERTGRRREARRGFEEIVAAGGDVWPVALAYQELARLHAVEGRTADAGRVLAAGLEHLPDDEKLLLELALLAERRGDPAAVQSALDRIVPRGGTGGSARHRYNQLPIQLIEETWRGLEASATAHRQSLAGAMGVHAGQETSP